MINEIFISKWDPVVRIPCMTPAQLDNELERICSRMSNKPGHVSLGPKIDPDREFDRGFEAGLETEVLTEYENGWYAGYESGYTKGRDAETRHRDKL